MRCIPHPLSKYVIFIFNLVISICALVLVIYGIFYMIDESRGGVNVFGNFFSFGDLAISVGIVIFFLSTIGCCGAYYENPCLLTFYSILLLALFVVQLTLGILAVAKISDYDSFFNDVKGVIQEMFDTGDPFSNYALQSLQREFQCCGINGPNDYNQTITSTTGYPASCCEQVSDPCLNPFTEGCASAFTNAIRDNIGVIGYVAICFTIVELGGAIFAFMVRKGKPLDEDYA